MTDQQPRAPQCPHRHGPMERTYIQSTGTHFTGIGYACRQCSEAGTGDLLEQEYQRGFEDGCKVSAQADHAHAVEDTEHARGLYYWKLRAEEAEARERDHFDRMRATNIQLKERTEERDRLREEVRLAKYGLTGIAEDRSTDPSARACITLRYMRESGDCLRCGNPQSDCQCYGSAAMSEDRLKHDVQEAQERVAGWSPSKQDAMLSEVNNVRSGSAAMEHERATNEAPHGRCWCRAPLNWRTRPRQDKPELTRLVLACSASLDHMPCLGCGQWVEWVRDGVGRTDHYLRERGGGVLIQNCPGPVPYGYCPRHPNIPKRNKPAQHEGDTGYLWCPECEEEARDE